jgi:hypothetical protein
MKQRAMFASARAMLWAGLKHEDRGLTIEGVGMLLSEYLRDEEVEAGTHNIDSILMVAIAAAVEQGALGRQKDPEPEPTDENDEKELGDGSDPNGPADVIDTVAVRSAVDPASPSQEN